jgi:hypothetical protein
LPSSNFLYLRQLAFWVKSRQHTRIREDQMKFFIAASFLFSSIATFAGEKYICVQSGEYEYSPAKVILTQIGEGKVVEGNPTPFSLEIYTDYTTKPSVKELVYVTTEDVMFHFNNKAKKISGLIFMDELDEAHVKIGKKEIRMNCN